jgi:ribosomal-protein-alanine N-acetyltransferase
VPGFRGPREDAVGGAADVSRNAVITTDRLVLRDFVPDDWREVHEYAVDPAVYKFMPWGPNSEEETREFVSRAIEKASRPVRLCYELAVTLRDGGKLIGGAGIRAANESFGSADMGYCLRHDAWGLGHGTEVARALIGFGFGTLGLHRIWATCDTENRASAAVLEKSGMTLEGVMRDDTWLRGKWRSSRLYAILEGEWDPRTRRERTQ